MMLVHDNEQYLKFLIIYPIYKNIVISPNLRTIHQVAKKGLAKREL